MRFFLSISLVLGICNVLYAEITIILITDCICGDTPTQAFDLVATGTAGPFTFEWTGPNSYSSTEQSPTDITFGGDYEVNVINAFGCVTTLNVHLPACENTPQSLDFQIQPNCPSNGGNIITTVIGGELPLQYEWSNGATGVANLYNVEAGQYSVTVTDNNGCSIVGSVEVPMPVDPPFDIVGEVGHACNEDDGYIKIDQTGIAQPVTFQWSSGQTEYRIDDLTNGNYYVTVTDGNDCSNEAEFTVYGFPSFTHYVVPVSCNSESDGRIELIQNNTPGTEPVSIEWFDGLESDMLIRDDLPAGNYSVTITGLNSGCTVTIPFSTFPTSNSGVYPYLQELKIVALNGSDQTLIYNGKWLETTTGCVEFNGGSQNLTQDLVDAMGNGDVSWQVYAIFNQIVSGGTIEITSENYSAASSINEISDVQEMPLTNSQVMDLVGTSGEFVINTEFFALTPTNVPTLNMFDLSNDLASCVDVPTIDPVTCLFEPQLEEEFIDPDPSHVLAFKCLDISLEANEEGDAFCLTTSNDDIIAKIFLMKPGGNWEYVGTEPGCYDLDPELFGEYCILIKTSTECSVQECITYCETVSHNLTHTIIEPSCTGTSDGSICVEIATDAPFTFIWDNGETGNCLENLPTGSYCLTLNPSAPCDIMDNYPRQYCFELGVDASSITVQEQVTPSCLGESTGEAYVYPSGGSSNFIITWFDGTIGNHISGLSPGYYTYTVTDACGATIQDYIQIEGIGSGDLGIAFLDPGPDACFSQLGLYITFPTDVVVTITHNDLGFTFTQEGIGNIIFENIPAGAYTVEIADACGNVTTIQDEVENYEVNLILGIKHYNFIRCEGETGQLTVILSGEGTSPFSILWSNGETTETIENLLPGIYMVTVTDDNGCTSSHGLTMHTNDILAVEIEEIVTACNDGENGAIYLSVEGGVPPYSYSWTEGQTTQHLVGVESGQHCVTVTDAEGCVVKGCYNIPGAELTVKNATVTNHDCNIGEGCNGAIDLTVHSSEMVSYEWSNGATTEDISGLCGGEYSVTISDGACEEVLTYSVDMSNGGELEDYQVEVTHNFGYGEEQSLNSAKLRITSEIFEEDGVLEVYLCSDFDTPIAIGSYDNLHERMNLQINYQYRFEDIFCFIYRSPTGCEYTGNIAHIGTCIDNSYFDGVTFEYEYTGDNDHHDCSEGGSNSYEIEITNIRGENFPYVIYVSMLEASSEEEMEFVHEIHIDENFNIYDPSQNPIEVTGVPDGTVLLSSDTYCNNSTNQAQNYTHDNCCIQPPCGLQMEGITDNYGDSYEYRFNYLAVHIVGLGECLDGGSNVVVSRPDENGNIIEGHPYKVEETCWTGRILVEYGYGYYDENGPYLELEVRPENDFYNMVYKTGGDDNWHPPSAGEYTVRITYEGTGDTDGVDCFDEVTFTYYSSDGYERAIGFIHLGNWWYDFNFTGENEIFNEAYFATWNCYACKPPPFYIYDNQNSQCPTDQVSFHPFANSIDIPYAHFFEWEPNSLNDPCNGGGTITYTDYDENGMLALFTRYIGPGESIGEIGLHPWWLPSNVRCERSGWCLFESLDVYGFEFPDGRPILAGWADLETCYVLPEPEISNPDDPVCDPDDTDTCPGDLVCVDGECLQPCQTDDDCLYGTCNEDGYCEEVEEECQPGWCPEGFECIDGECTPVEPGCEAHFLSSDIHCNQSNPCTFSIQNSGPVTLRIQTQTFGFANSFTVTISSSTGTNEHLIDCNATGQGWEESFFPIPNDATVTILAESCGEESDGYHWTAWCANNGQNFNDEESSLFLVDADNTPREDDFSLYPNPFTNAITLEYNNSDVVFNGIVSVINAQGIEVYSLTQEFQEGHNLLYLDEITGLQPGLYTIVFYGDSGFLQSRNIIKM